MATSSKILQTADLLEERVSRQWCSHVGISISFDETKLPLEKIGFENLYLNKEKGVLIRPLGTGRSANACLMRYGSHEYVVRLDHPKLIQNEHQHEFEVKQVITHAQFFYDVHKTTTAAFAIFEPKQIWGYHCRTFLFMPNLGPTLSCYFKRDEKNNPKKSLNSFEFFRLMLALLKELQEVHKVGSHRSVDHWNIYVNVDAEEFFNVKFADFEESVRGSSHFAADIMRLGFIISELFEMPLNCQDLFIERKKLIDLIELISNSLINNISLTELVRKAEELCIENYANSLYKIDPTTTVKEFFFIYFSLNTHYKLFLKQILPFVSSNNDFFSHWRRKETIYSCRFPEKFKFLCVQINQMIGSPSHLFYEKMESTQTVVMVNPIQLINKIFLEIKPPTEQKLFTRLFLFGEEKKEPQKTETEEKKESKREIMEIEIFNEVNSVLETLYVIQDELKPANLKHLERILQKISNKNTITDDEIEFLRKNEAKALFNMIKELPKLFPLELIDEEFLKPLLAKEENILTYLQQNNTLDIIINFLCQKNKSGVRSSQPTPSIF